MVASMVGIDNRATMDIDATVRNYILSAEDARKMIEDIISVSLEDDKMVVYDEFLKEYDCRKKYYGVKQSIQKKRTERER